jgi:hypothetical protein
MKKTHLLIITITSLAASGQIDSNFMKASITLQARDWLYIEAHIKNQDSFERLYDSIKSRVHVLLNPQSTVTAKIDSINVGNLISISDKLRNQNYGYSVFVFTRINTAIRGVSNAYLQRKLDEMDSAYTTFYENLLINELQRVKDSRK